ncbi:MAG: FAD-dependent oxidoreductase [Clostridium sp.]|nr:FAD-dependent oxidoreductase [Clostridium sp.]MCM1444216.1 FAD-dependent oxidoreductase [Candidatus Amulumruptor caecigallinarius]
MSIWNKEEINTKNQSLTENIDIDTLIIGAGITGMTTAYFLRNNKSLCIVDASKIGHGVTLNTTAKINYFQDRVYTKITNLVSEEIAKKYLNSQKYAINILKEIIQKENIDCNLQKVSSFVFANNLDEVEPLKEEAEFLKSNGVKIIEKELPENVISYKSYCVDDTYIFNPIKYLQAIYNILIKNNINIYENSKITKIEKQGDIYICHGDNFKINVKKIILACHYPYFVFPFLTPLKSYIKKSYIVISKVKKDLNYTCISSNTPTYSCRFYRDNNNIYKICLGESHNLAFKQYDTCHFKKVKEMFKIKEEDVVMTYSNTDIMTADHMPYIGALKPNMYMALGYNAWGMTNGILASKIISDIILNNENEYIDVFKPHRINGTNLIKSPIFIFSQIKSFLGAKFNKEKFWYPNGVDFITKNGEPLAIYKDEKGVKHIVKNKCPHFGCSLIFNEQEKTWDCPCHSSRFDIDGKCIKGPSNYDIYIKD